MAGKKGQPTKFVPEFTEQVRELCLLGATDEQIGRFFKVTETTINNWKITFPDFFESIKSAKEQFDLEVASSLKHRALGYSHKTEKIFNASGQPLIVETVEHYPPDTTAAIFWLKNRQPKQWRDKIEQDITSNGETLGMVIYKPQQLTDPDEAI